MVQRMQEEKKEDEFRTFTPTSASPTPPSSFDDNDPNRTRSTVLQEDVARNPTTGLCILALSSGFQEMQHDLATSQQQIQMLQQQVQDLQQHQQQMSAQQLESASALSVSSSASSSSSFSLPVLLNTATGYWNTFFHAQVGEKSILLASRMRIAYAMLVILDKLVLTLDMDSFLSPTNGILPLWAERDRMADRGHYTILQWFPESDAFLWSLHFVGLVQAFLLLLGIAPRFNGIGVFLSHVWFQHHNHLIFDGQDVMFRVWCFHLMFLPIHRLTLPGWIQQRFGDTATVEQHKIQQQKETYPIWPFRLLQMQICLVYLGAGGVKWTGGHWTSGTALYYMVHNDDFYGKLWNPDFIFNNMFAIRLFTYKALLIETIVPFLIWPNKTRKVMLALIVMLHLGMEVTLNMHCFEWLTIWAWCSFLAEPIIAV